MGTSGAKTPDENASGHVGAKAPTPSNADFFRKQLKAARIAIFTSWLRGCGKSADKSLSDARMMGRLKPLCGLPRQASASIDHLIRNGQCKAAASRRTPKGLTKIAHGTGETVP